MYHLENVFFVPGVKVYGPVTCCFVPKEINNLFRVFKIRKSNLPTGISKNKEKFLSEYKGKRLGTFNTPEEAFSAYKTAKETEIKRLAEEYKTKITPEVYTAMLNYQVEITD